MVALIIGRKLDQFFNNPLIQRGSDVLQDRSVWNFDPLYLFDFHSFFDGRDVALLGGSLIPEDS